MAGNRNSGRPQADDPKVKPPSYRLRQSTVDEIESIAYELNIPRSEILQVIIENGLNLLRALKKK